MTRAFTFAIVLPFVLATAIAISDHVDDDVDKRGQCSDALKPTGTCKRFKNLCSNEMYSKWMKRNCAMTCDNCPKLKTSSVYCQRRQSSGCSQWKSKGFCSVSSPYYKFMTESCAVVCGLCPGVKVTKPTPAAVTVNIRECLVAHNNYRARHGAPPLTWNSKMAREAQEYALKLADIYSKEKRLKHAKGIPYGENLAMQWRPSNPCQQATKSWYDEVKDYSYSNPGFSMATGHFTQVVWKATKRLGVGIVKNGDYVFVVARYDPPGNVNVRSKFIQNVERPQY